jgi:hypothetical protein
MKTSRALIAALAGVSVMALGSAAVAGILAVTAGAEVSFGGFEYSGGVAESGATTLSFAGTELGTTGTEEGTAVVPGHVVVARIVVDGTAPTITGTASPARNAAGWNNTDVTVSFACADDTSGIALCSEPITLATNGTGQSASGTARDNAGNVADTTVTGINIDKTAPPTPTISQPIESAIYLLNQRPLAASYSCAADALSGLRSCIGRDGDGTLVSNGFTVDTRSVGNKTFTVTATDAADNTSAAHRHYVIAYQVCVQYNQGTVWKTGTAVPIALQICDAARFNKSSATIGLQFVRREFVSASATGKLQTGSATSTAGFTFDGTKSNYAWAYPTTGLADGHWRIWFTIDGDPTQHSIDFHVRSR